MNKLKFDSLYKFIVSIGLALISLPFVFGVWFLDSNDILMIKEIDLLELTNNAQEIIKTEQTYKLNIINNFGIFICIGVLLILIGVIIVIYGIIQWNNRVQKNENKSMELSNILMENQIRGMTKEEKEAKIKEEIKQYETDNQEPNNKMEYKERYIRYIEIQNEVIEKIKNVFKYNKIFEDIKIEKERYDCIIQRKYMDYIFEIKYVSDIKLIKSRLLKISSQTAKRQLTYLRDTKRTARSITIIIIDYIDDKIKLENKKLFDLVEQENKKKDYLERIIITDIKNLESELIDIKGDYND